MKDLYTEVMALDTGGEVWDYTEKLHDQIKADKGGSKGGGEKMQMLRYLDPRRWKRQTPRRTFSFGRLKSVWMGRREGR